MDKKLDGVSLGTSFDTAKFKDAADRLSKSFQDVRGRINPALSEAEKKSIFEVSRDIAESAAGEVERYVGLPSGTLKDQNEESFKKLHRITEEWEALRQQIKTTT